MRKFCSIVVFEGAPLGGRFCPQATTQKTAKVITNHPETRMGDKVLDQLFVSRTPSPERTPDTES